MNKDTSKVSKWAKKRFVMVLGIVLILSLFLGLLFYYNEKSKVSNPTIYFQETFENGIVQWENYDAIWTLKDEERVGIVNLKRREFIAPHLTYTLSLNQSPPEAFVWHLAVKVSSFSNKATTLGAISTPTGLITIVVNEKNQLGLAEGIFSPAMYQTSPLYNLKRDKWQDIYVYVNEPKKQIILYLGNKKVLTQEWKSPIYPVQKIWLGVIWTNGVEDYSSSIDISYDSVTLGDKKILPKPSFVDIFLDLFRDFFV